MFKPYSRNQFHLQEQTCGEAQTQPDVRHQIALSEKAVSQGEAEKDKG